MNFISARTLIQTSQRNSKSVLNLLSFRFRSSATMSIKMRENDIISSEQDKRKYRGLVFENELKVMLISDPTTDKSAAAMDIRVGGMSDPWELPGLAHFCEHMLFLGTKKYPDENEYSKYLSEHSGGSNAYTALDHTNYYFDVSPEAFPGALDRFAQFFLEPLFTETAVDREVNAVHSEHSKNVKNDFWRLNQLEKATCNPKHDYCKFNTGNKDTLDTLPKARGESVREVLLQFHKKWYSSNIMTLSVLGKENLDDLEKMIVELFAGIENKNVVVPEWLEHPFTDECLQKRISVVPVKDIRKLSISFPIPDLNDHYKTSPGHYLGHLIGHEGPGSLLSYLKSLGWVNSLVGGQGSGAKGFSFFIVNSDLTEEGLEHVDDIVTAVFQYLDLLKKTGLQPWIFEECRDINNMTFRFKDKERPQGYVTSVAELMQYYPLKETLSGGYTLTEYKADLISSVLDCLTPQKLRVGVIAKAMEGQTDLEEKWYGTPYKIECLSQETLDQWTNPPANAELFLPTKNEFVPTNFELVQSNNTSKVPVLLTETPLQRTWYKLDDQFKLPKATFHVELFNRMAYVEPNHTNLLHMFVQLFKDALTEYSYAADLAGLKYDLYNTKCGLILALSGYNDKMPVLLEKVMDKFTTFKIDPKRFDIHKENYIRALNNFAADQPYQHSIYYTSLLLSEIGWSKEELLSFSDDITVANLERFMATLLSNLHLEFLVHGNLSEDSATNLCEIVSSKLRDQSNTKPLLPSQFTRQREFQLEKGCSYVFEAKNDFHKSSAVETLYQFDQQGSHENMLGEMLVQIFSEPVFEQLRTKEQLGYIVWCVLRRANGTQGLRVIVQGDKSPAYLDSRIEAFLVKMREKLATMTDEEFQCHRDSLVKRRSEKPKKLSHQSGVWWTEMMSNQYNFLRDELEVEHLMTVTKADVIQYFETRLHHESPDRKKLSVQVKSSCPEDKEDETPPTDFNEAPILKTAIVVEDISQFKRSHPLYPLMTPFISLTGAAKSKL